MELDPQSILREIEKTVEKGLALPQLKIKAIELKQSLEDWIILLRKRAYIYAGQRLDLEDEIDDALDSLFKLRFSLEHEIRQIQTKQAKEKEYIQNIAPDVSQIKMKQDESRNDKDETANKEIIPPPLPELEEIANDESLGILRLWTNGKYKCSSLPRFIKKYSKSTDNLTPTLIRDYLISERTGKPYSDKNIAKEMKLHGPGRRT
jgi:hypothetical protein